MSPSTTATPPVTASTTRVAQLDLLRGRREGVVDDGYLRRVYAELPGEPQSRGARRVVGRHVQVPDLGGDAVHRTGQACGPGGDRELQAGREQLPLLGSGDPQPAVGGEVQVAEGEQADAGMRGDP